MYFIARLFIFIVLPLASLQSEIELINVKWALGFCPKNCEENLGTRLKTIPQIAEFNIPIGGAQAQIRWKPLALFSYPIINLIIKGAGIHVDQVFVKVRGIIEYDRHNVSLVSLGDGTRFVLLSPIDVPAVPSQGVSRHNLDSYKLKPLVYERLVQYANESRVVTIQGTLFDPWRYVELYLVIQSATTTPPLVKPHNEF